MEKIEEVIEKSLEDNSDVISYEDRDLYMSHMTHVDYENDGKDLNAKIINIETSIFVDEDYIEDVTTGEEKEKIGEIKSHKVSDLNGCHYNTIYEACDSMTQNLYDAFNSCFKNIKGEIYRKKKKEKEDPFGIYDEIPDSFVYIDTVIIDEKHRGKGIGYLAVKRLVEEFGKSTLVIVKPFAIEDEDNKLAHNRVKKFWNSLGFKEVGKSGFYMVDSWEIMEFKRRL